MEIIVKGIDEIIPYEKNPRKNDKAVKYVANSIKEFGFKVPIIVDKNNVIVAGHTRLKAAKQLGLTEVPVIIADDLTPEQIKAFRLADNKVSEFAKWDDDLLLEELGEIVGINMDDFGFLNEESENNPYTTKVKIPQYEITGEIVTLQDCLDDTKTKELIAEIESSNVSDEQKAFLINASYRHLQFNYKNIAEYYANASKEMQELMEKSALVIIDLDDAIADGYAELVNKLEESSNDER